MKIKHLSREKLIILCHSAEDYKQAVNCYNRHEEDAPEYLAKLVRVTGGEPVEVESVASSEYVNKGGGYGRFAADVTEWLAPYFAELKKRTGCEPFAVDFTPIASQITHTHITERIAFDGVKGEAVHVSHVYGMSNDREISSEAFERYGKARLVEHVGHEFGKSYTPPEFEEVRGGLYKRNHSLRQTTYTPAPENGDAWQFLFGEWLARFATDEQKAIMARFSRVVRSSELYPSLRDSHSSAIHLDDYSASMPWAEFQEAGKAVAA